MDRVPLLDGFDWGPAEDFPFLPRVQIDRIVLRTAQWRIGVHIRANDLLTNSPQAFADMFHHWRTHWQVPRHVYLTTGDNRLLLDLESASQVEELRLEVQSQRSDGHVVLQEVIPNLDEAWVQGPGGRFLTEFVVSLTRRSANRMAVEKVESTSVSRSVEESTRCRAGMPVQAADRLRSPGSEWLFLKLYCGDDLQNDLIGGPVRTFAGTALSRGLADDWFFLRYSDPDPHVRLRFRGEPDCLREKLLPELCAWASELMVTDLCTHFAFDTYEREVERYGGIKGIQTAEETFCADSQAAAELLHLAHSSRLRLDLAVLTVVTADDLLAGLGLTEEARLELYRQTISRREGGPEYQRRKVLLRSLLGTEGPGGRVTDFQPVFPVLTARRIRLDVLGKRLTILAQRGDLSRPITMLYASFVHMHCNRLLGTDRSAERKVLGMLLRTREGLVRAPETRPRAG